MALEDTLKQARDTIRDDPSMSEAEVEASVIKPVLRSLGWDDADRKQWRVQYPVDEGRVDQALLDGAGQPLVFVEAKKHGALDPKAEDQLFGYATGNGIPTLVLTDGDTWDLYLSLAAGKPPDRRFAHLVLTETRDLTVVAEDLQAFLGRDAIWSGEARLRSEDRLKEVKNRKLGRSGLELAWSQLLSEGSEEIRGALIQRVEQNVQARPNARDVNDFLRRQVAGIVSEDAAYAESSVPTQADGKAFKPTRIIGFKLLGQSYATKNNREALFELTAALRKRDKSYLEKLRNYRSNAQMKIPHAARTGDPFLTHDPPYDYQLVPETSDWFIHVRYSTKSLVRQMCQMVEAASLDPDRDFKPTVRDWGQE